MESMHTNWSKEDCQNYYRDSLRLIKNDYEPWAKRIYAYERNAEVDNLRIADIGCGPGFLSFELNKLFSGGRYYLVDNSEEMLSFAEQEAERAALDAKFIVSPAERSTLPDCAIDIAICKHLLLSTDDVTACLEDVYRILVVGGRAYVIDANPESSRLLARFCCWYLKMVISEDRAERSWHAYRHGIPYGEVIQQMNKIGFKNIAVSCHFPMAYFITATK